MDVITRWTLSFHKSSVGTAAAQTDIMSLASKSSESLGMIMMRWNRKEMALHLMIRSSQMPSTPKQTPRGFQMMPMTPNWKKVNCLLDPIGAVPRLWTCPKRKRDANWPVMTSCKMDSLWHTVTILNVTSLCVWVVLPVSYQCLTSVTHGIQGYQGSMGSNKRCTIKHRELSCFMTLVYE
jgi:hypothetical protein